jgi:hypothetical protein
MSQSSRELIKKDYTTNTTLEEEAHRLGIPLHFCWHKDKLPRLTKDGLYIINLADEGDPGTHWTALWKEGKEYCYWDSFGFVPPLEVEEKLPKYWYNATIIQDPGDGGCGSYCIEFGEFMNDNRGMPVKKRFQAFLNLWFDDFRKNDRILKRLQIN